MLNVLSGNDFIVYGQAIDAAGEVISLVRRVPAPLKALADQAIRAPSSVPANIAKGHGRSGRDRLHHWGIADGSAKEVDRHLRLPIHAGAIGSTRAGTSLRLFDEVRTITWRLLHPKA